MGIGENIGEGVGENTGSSGDRTTSSGEFTPARVMSFESGALQDATAITASTDNFDAGPGVITYDALGPTPVNGGSFCAKVHSTLGSVNVGGSFWGGYTSPKEGDELWVRFYSYIPSGWVVGGDPGWMKWFRVDDSSSAGKVDITMLNGAVGFAIDNWEIMAYAVPASSAGGVVNYTAETYAHDRWVRNDVYLYASRDPTKGIVRHYLDGTLITELREGPSYPNGIITLSTASSSFTGLYFISWYNGGADTTGAIWVDQFMVATSLVDRPTNIGSDGNLIIGDYFV